MLHKSPSGLESSNSGPRDGSIEVQTPPAAGSANCCVSRPNKIGQGCYATLDLGFDSFDSKNKAKIKKLRAFICSIAINRQTERRP